MTTDVTRLAAALVQARRAGEAVDLNGELATLDGATAYAIQNEGFRLWAGGPVAGYKIGWAGAAARAKAGLVEPVFGRFAPGDVLPAGAGHSLAGRVKPGLEGEVVFHVVRPLPATPGRAVTGEEVLAACSVGVGFDLMDSRLTGGASTWLATVADNCGAGAVLLGQARSALSEGGRALVDRVHLTLWRNGEMVQSGSALTLDGDPVELVAWLATKLISLGEGLLPGQFILTGAMAGPQWLVSGGEWEVRSSELGRARVEVTEGKHATE